jgi:adenine-specific DNA-methyltransferase
MAKKPTPKKIVESLRHEDATRKNIPTAELQPVLQKKEQDPLRVAYERRNRDLDPQLVWRGKDEQDWSDLVVQAPPLYIQEKIHPKVLIDDLLRQTRESQPAPDQIDLFADFNGMPQGVDKTDFYQHDQNWSNRMILGDSLQVMASLAEREGLRGKVQCIYIDPPYGIKFNSNFQWSTTSRDVKDGNIEHITREPEQVRAFRDTWRDGIHSYLTYLRDRLTVARDLLAESGSIFVQIGDENVHLIRTLLSEVFGDSNFVAQIAVQKVTGVEATALAQNYDYILFFAKNAPALKFRRPLLQKTSDDSATSRYDQVMGDGWRRPATKEEKNGSPLPQGARRYQLDNLVSSEFRPDTTVEFRFQARSFFPGSANHWKTSTTGMRRLGLADRLQVTPVGGLRYVRALDDYAAITIGNAWTDISASVQSRTDPKIYVVQTSAAAIQRCLLIATDPGDLVLDPTCGSGTTATVAEQWGRRWITVDTSRVALALARARIMGARYSYYLLADSRDGQLKEAEITGKPPSSQPARANLRQGFVYDRIPHVKLGAIANNAEIDVIWEKWQGTLEPLRERLNSGLRQGWEEWEIPREADDAWSTGTKKLHADWWEARIARQKEIDASIAAKAESEYLYDKPYEDGRKVRVAGPFTVESLSPHRAVGVDENDDLIDRTGEKDDGFGTERGFTEMILENLRIAGVQQAHREDKIVFTALTTWPGRLICADGRYREGGKDGAKDRRAAIFIGPEFGTVSRPDLVTAAREAGDADFDVLIACAFSYDAHSSEFDKLGRIPVLKARMNADLHMADDLKNTGKGNLFVVFGEPDIEILSAEAEQIRVKVKGVDVFHPSTGEVRSDGAEGIACWLIDTNYNEESFFVRHAYFLGANDPYSALKTTLRAEINEEAWATLHSDMSRPFPKPTSGRIAVKVINHLGDEVMKVFRV